MSPPLISDYKIHFTIKRILQTFFGGPVLWIRPFVLIVVQILLFIIPIIELIVVRVVIKRRHHWQRDSSVSLEFLEGIGVDKNETDNDEVSALMSDEQEERPSTTTDSGSNIQLNYYWIGLIVGITVLVVDLVLTLLISLLKAIGRRDAKKIQPLEVSALRRGSRVSRAEDGPGFPGRNVLTRNSIDRGHDPEGDRDHPAPSMFLAEEDQLEYKGLLHSSTWNFIVPNVCVPIRLSFSCVLRQLACVVGTSLTFGLCSPLIMAKSSPAIFSAFGIFTLCTARYSALFHTPFEIATFGTVRQGKHVTYRMLYVFALGVSYAISYCIAEGVPRLPFLIILACLPFLWSFGVLPPLDALFPWAIETILHIFGGSASFFYFGSVLCMSIVVGSSVLVLITDEYFTLSVIIQCIFGYMISCDMGIPRYFFKSSSSVCGLEAMPFNKCVSKLLPPTMQIVFSVLFIYLGLALFQKDHVDDLAIVEQGDKWIVETVLMVWLALTVSSIKANTYYLLGIGRLGKFWSANSNGLLAAQRVLLRFLTAGLHLLITIELGKLDHTGKVKPTIISVEGDLVTNISTTTTTPSIIMANGTNANSNSTVDYEMLSPNASSNANSTSSSQTSWFSSSDLELEQNTKSLIQLFMYSMTIRAFALSITHPKQTLIDLALALAVKYGGFGVEQLHFPVILFFISFPRKWVWRFLRGFGLFIRILYSTYITTLIDSKVRVFGLTFVCLPLTLVSIVLAAIVDGATLTALFTLPIFIIGFPRPNSFWKQRWFPFKFTRSSSSQVVRAKVVFNNNLDYVIYEDMSANFVQAFVRKIYDCGMRLQNGYCFLARFDDRLIFLRVLTATWNSVYIQAKGLEMQEQTSCHHHEAAWVDELFESTPYMKLPRDRDPIEASEVKSTSFLAYYIRRLLNGQYSTSKSMSILQPMFTLSLPTYTESKSSIEPLTEDEQKLTFRKMFFCAFTFLWIQALCHGQNKASNGHISLICSGMHLFDRRRSSNTSYASSTTSGNGNGGPASPNGHNASASGNESMHHLTNSSVISKFPYLPGMEPVAESRTSPGSLELEGAGEKPIPRPSTVIIHRPGTYTKATHRNYTQSELEWIQYQLNDMTDEAEIRRIVKTTWKIWSMVTGAGINDHFVNQICLYQFFEDGFKTSVEQGLKNLSNRSIDRVNAELVVKSFRYAAKLTLDHLYTAQSNGPEADAESNPQQIFYEISAQIRGFERGTEFCTYKEVAECIQKKQSRIITMTQPSSELKQLHIFNHHELRSRHRPVFVPVEEGDVSSAAASAADGVRISVGQLSSSVVDGIWSNVNLELLYLTSDDDERYSIQHDKILLRNICTQAAASPLGYFVYDSVFLVNPLDRFKIQQMH